MAAPHAPPLRARARARAEGQTGLRGGLRIFSSKSPIFPAARSVKRACGACDRFAGMWNNRKIRGDRTVLGRGGGRPAELFLDPVGSDALMLDDQRYQDLGMLYGEEVPFRDPGEPERTRI